MAFTYDINKTSIDKKSQNCLLACHMLAGIINLFVNTFLVAHIYSFNGSTYDYLFNVGIYNIFIYISMGLFTIPITKIVDKTNRISVFRIGLVIKAILVMIIIFFGESLSKLLILAGVLNGFSEALYYSSYNVIKEEMVSRKSMNSYSSYSFVISKAIEVICPIVLGAIIDTTTYSTTALLVLLICIAQVIVSLGIKSQRPDGSHYDLKEYFSLLKENPQIYKKIKLIYFTTFIYGTTTMLAILINVCVMLEYGSNFSLGTITGIFALLSVIVLILIKKLSKPKKRNWIFILFPILSIISSIIFAININNVTIIILNGVIAVTSILYKYIYDVYRNGILKESGLYNEISEHQSIVEVIMNMSRIMSFGLLLIVSLTNSMFIFKTLMIIFVVFSSSMHILLMIYENKYVKDTEK